MSNRLLFAGLVLLALIALLIRGFVREIIVVPLLYGLWIAGLILQSAPQVLLWSLFILVALIAASRSLIAPRLSVRRRRQGASHTGRLGEWAMLIDLARGDALSRWRLAHRLEELAIQTLAEHERAPVDQVRQRLRNGKANVPPEIQRYLTARMPTGQRRAVIFHGATANQGAHMAALDLDPEHVVRFLEEKVEVQDGDAPS